MHLYKLSTITTTLSTSYIMNSTGINFDGFASHFTVNPTLKFPNVSVRCRGRDLHKERTHEIVSNCCSVGCPYGFAIAYRKSRGWKWREADPDRVRLRSRNSSNFHDRRSQQMLGRVSRDGHVSRSNKCMKTRTILMVRCAAAGQRRRRRVFMHIVWGTLVRAARPCLFNIHRNLGLLNTRIGKIFWILTNVFSDKPRY